MSRNLMVNEYLIGTKIALEEAAFLNKKARHHISDIPAHDPAWIGPQNYCIPLCYINEVNEDQIMKFKKELTEALQDLSSFYAMTGICQYSPKNQNPEFLAVQVHSGGCLRDLSVLITSAATEANITIKDREYQPFIRLANLNQLSWKKLKPTLSLPSIKLRVKEIFVLKNTKGNQLQISDSLINLQLKD